MSRSGLVLPVLLGAVTATAQPVGSQFRVNSYTTSDQDIAAVAADSAGNFVVVWQSYGQDGSLYGIYGQRYAPSGARLGLEFRVNTYTTFTQQIAEVSSDAAGDFVVVWQSRFQDGSGYGIFGQRYAPSGAPAGGEFRVNTYTTNKQDDVWVASAPTGEFVVVWQSYQNGGAGDIYGQRYSADGAPAGAQFPINTYTTGIQDFPVVTYAPGGVFAVAWQSPGQDGSLDGVFMQRYAVDGTPLGSELQVNTYTTSYQYIPGITSTADGFVVVWSSYGQDGSSYGIFAQRFASTGERLAAEFQVNTYTTGSQTNPDVGSDANGDFVVVWTSYGQSAPLAVYGQRYDGFGAPQGGEFLVGTFTTSSPEFPAVGVSNGRFVVAWDTTIDGLDVVAQRFQFQSCTLKGDVNADGSVNVADVFYLINYLFAGGPAPLCSSDVDGNGSVNVADVFYLINYLFASGPAPK
jgi:hypothetical protein